jgi:glycine cleavage system H protein
MKYMVKVEGFNFPPNLYYSKDHLWIDLTGSEAKVGFTSLGEALCKEIVHVDLPLEGDQRKQGEEIGSFETIKAVFRIHAPLSGKVTKTNNALYKQPDMINEEPYGKGWLFVIAVNDPKLELKELMDSKKAAKYYKTIIDEEKEKFGDYDEP